MAPEALPGKESEFREDKKRGKEHLSSNGQVNILSRGSISIPNNNKSNQKLWKTRFRCLHNLVCMSKSRGWNGCFACLSKDQEEPLKWKEQLQLKATSVNVFTASGSAVHRGKLLKLLPLTWKGWNTDSQWFDAAEECLHVLEQCTRGQPKELTRSLSHLVFSWPTLKSVDEKALQA